MTVQSTLDKQKEQREKRATLISSMRLVNRKGDLFIVSTPSLILDKPSYQVKRDDFGKIRCNCLEFLNEIILDSTYRCEHIMAVKIAIKEKTTESDTKQNVNKHKKNKSVIKQKNINTMTHNTCNEMLYETKELAGAFGNITNNQSGNVNKSNNIIDFPSKLEKLRKTLNPDLVKIRQISTNDSDDKYEMIDYVEWYTVADILDRETPNWLYSVKDIKKIGEIITITVALTIDEITREGIGTALAKSEIGVKKAEHDALKRAALKFGIARKLYKNESEAIKIRNNLPVNTKNDEINFPLNPLAKSLSDLITTKQLRMIWDISKEIGIKADEESNNLMDCQINELSKQAASCLINYLQRLKEEQKPKAQQIPMRRAG